MVFFLCVAMINHFFQLGFKIFINISQFYQWAVHRYHWCLFINTVSLF